MTNRVWNKFRRKGDKPIHPEPRHNLKLCYNCGSWHQHVVLESVHIVLTQPGTLVSFWGMFIYSLFNFRKLRIFRCFPFSFLSLHYFSCSFFAHFLNLVTFTLIHSSHISLLSTLFSCYCSTIWPTILTNSYDSTTIPFILFFFHSLSFNELTLGARMHVSRVYMVIILWFFKHFT